MGDAVRVCKINNNKAITTAGIKSNENVWQQKNEKNLLGEREKAAGGRKEEEKTFFHIIIMAN